MQLLPSELLILFSKKEVTESKLFQETAKEIDHGGNLVLEAQVNRN